MKNIKNNNFRKSVNMILVGGVVLGGGICVDHVNAGLLDQIAPSKKECTILDKAEYKKVGNTMVLTRVADENCGKPSKEKIKEVVVNEIGTDKALVTKNFWKEENDLLKLLSDSDLEVIRNNNLENNIGEIFHLIYKNSQKNKINFSNREFIIVDSHGNKILNDKTLTAYKKKNSRLALGANGNKYSVGKVTGINGLDYSSLKGAKEQTSRSNIKTAKLSNKDVQEYKNHEAKNLANKIKNNKKIIENSEKFTKEEKEKLYEIQIGASGIVNKNYEAAALKSYLYSDGTGFKLENKYGYSSAQYGNLGSSTSSLTSSSSSSPILNPENTNFNLEEKLEGAAVEVYNALPDFAQDFIKQKALEKAIDNAQMQDPGVIQG